MGRNIVLVSILVIVFLNDELRFFIENCNSLCFTKALAIFLSCHSKSVLFTEILRISFMPVFSTRKLMVLNKQVSEVSHFRF